MVTTPTKPKHCRTWEHSNKMSSLQVLISVYDLVEDLEILDCCFCMHAQHDCCTSGEAFLRCRSLPVLCLLLFFSL